MAGDAGQVAIRERGSGTQRAMAQRVVDCLIVGAGIAGLLLARALRQRGWRVAVAHDPSCPGAGEAAVGLLNPVRGRRCTLAWRAPEAFAAARETYGRLAAEWGKPVLRPLPVVRAFASAEERGCFERRVAAVEAAGFACRDLTKPPAGLRGTAHGTVAVEGGGALDARALTAGLRGQLRAAGTLVERGCRGGELVAGGGNRIDWPAGQLQAGCVVLATGAAEIATPLAGPLPLRPVRGESLLVRAPGLDASAAFVCGHHLAPLGGDLWSCGGTKQPGMLSNIPSREGRDELEAFLAARVAVPWEIAGHWCGVRAATRDGRPLVGRVGGDPRVLTLNGLGSQGFAVGPWLAEALAAHLVAQQPLPAELDPARLAPRPAPADHPRWHAVDVARTLALRQLAPGDLAIDLTVGNGGDTLWLAAAVGPEGAVLGIDVQEEAIRATRRRLEAVGCDVTVDLRCADHARLATLVPGEWRGRVGAAVANLGYLPRSDSPVVTRPETTVAAFAAALGLLRVGGALVAVVYTQHAGGVAELAAVERWAGGLEPARFTVAWSRAPDGSPRAPVVLAVERKA